MTTIISVRKNNRVVMAGDGQVSMGNTVTKASARKIRRTFDGKVIAGFAAQQLTLLRFLKNLMRSWSNIMGASYDLPSNWRRSGVRTRCFAV